VDVDSLNPLDPSDEGTSASVRKARGGLLRRRVRRMGIMGLIVLASVVTYWVVAPSSDERVLVLPLHEVVEHEIRFKLQPYVVGDRVVVLVEVSSYQHAEHIAARPDKLFALSDDLGNVYEPVRWDGETVSAFIKRGKLVFEEVDTTWLRLRLTFFSDEDSVFEWVRDQGIITAVLPTLVPDE